MISLGFLIVSVHLIGNIVNIAGFLRFLLEQWKAFKQI